MDDVVVKRGPRIAREAAIAERLAPEVRYPEVLDVEGDRMVRRWVRGEPLGRAWSTLTMEERTRAIAQLAHMLDALHATNTDGIDDGIEGPHAVTRADVLATAERAAHEVGNDMVLIYEVATFIRERWDAAFDAPHDVLIHGDCHLDNALWDGRDVVALLDLEWARRAWVECDVEILLAVGSHPQLFADYPVEAAAFRPIPELVANARPAWFRHPRLAERIALLFASRTLGHLVDAPGSAVRHAHLRAVVGR